MPKCKNTSIEKCFSCQSYDCKNLYGPIKENSLCYKMMKEKLFDECIFLKAGEDGLNGCTNCTYFHICSSLIRQRVDFL